MKTYITQVLRALSRLLNALAGGEGDTTFSAASWGLALKGSRWGRLRVKLIDWLNGTPGHCKAAWEWHRDRGLLVKDSAD